MSGQNPPSASQRAGDASGPVPAGRTSPQTQGFSLVTQLCTGVLYEYPIPLPVALSKEECRRHRYFVLGLPVFFNGRYANPCQISPSSLPELHWSEKKGRRGAKEDSSMIVTRPSYLQRPGPSTYSVERLSNAPCASWLAESGLETWHRPTARSLV